MYRYVVLLLSAMFAVADLPNANCAVPMVSASTEPYSPTHSSTSGTVLQNIARFIAARARLEYAVQACLHRVRQTNLYRIRRGELNDKDNALSDAVKSGDAALIKVAKDSQIHSMNKLGDLFDAAKNSDPAIIAAKAEYDAARANLGPEELSLELNGDPVLDAESKLSDVEIVCYRRFEGTAAFKELQDKVHVAHDAVCRAQISGTPQEIAAATRIWQLALNKLQQFVKRAYQTDPAIVAARADVAAVKAAFSKPSAGEGTDAE